MQNCWNMISEIVAEKKCANLLSGICNKLSYELLIQKVNKTKPKLENCNWSFNPRKCWIQTLTMRSIGPQRCCACACRMYSSYDTVGEWTKIHAMHPSLQWYFCMYPRDSFSISITTHWQNPSENYRIAKRWGKTGIHENRQTHAHSHTILNHHHNHYPHSVASNSVHKWLFWYTNNDDDEWTSGLFTWQNVVYFSWACILDAVEWKTIVEQRK